MWTPTHVQVTVHRAEGLLLKGKNKTNDCFVTIALGKEKYQTSVKEKASSNVEWHEECELQIPQQGNTAEIVLTALHRNFLGVDEFLGTVSIPLSTLEVYDRPKNRWYTLNSKPGKENTKERGELEVKIGFIVKAGSLMDLTKRERHKSSLGQLSNAAHSIGGSLLSIGSIEKRKSLKKLAKSIGSRVKGKSKSKLNEDDLDEKDEHYFRPTNYQEPGEADPGVISEDDDEFTFDVLSHKSSASSLNVPVSAANSTQNNSPSNKTSNSSMPNERSTPPPANVAPSKPPRFTISSGNTPKVETSPLAADEWGRKLYGKQGNNVLKRLENKTKTLNDDQRNEKELSSSPRTSPDFKYKDIPEPLSPAPREIITKLNRDEKSLKDKIIREEVLERSLKEEKHSKWSPRLERPKKDKKERDNNKNRDSYHDGHINTERIIIGGEDRMKNNGDMKGRLPHEVIAQFAGRSREDLIELIWQLQDDVAQKKKRLHDLEDYIDSLLLRVIESSPRLLQNPYQSQRRLSSPGHQ